MGITTQQYPPTHKTLGIWGFDTGDEFILGIFYTLLVGIIVCMVFAPPAIVGWLLILLFFQEIILGLSLLGEYLSHWSNRQDSQGHDHLFSDMDNKSLCRRCASAMDSTMSMNIERSQQVPEISPHHVASTQGPLPTLRSEQPQRWSNEAVHNAAPAVQKSSIAVHNSLTPNSLTPTALPVSPAPLWSSDSSSGLNQHNGHKQLASPPPGVPLKRQEVWKIELKKCSKG